MSFVRGEVIFSSRANNFENPLAKGQVELRNEQCTLILAELDTLKLGCRWPLAG